MSQADKTTAQNKTAKSYLLSIGSHFTAEKKSNKQSLKKIKIWEIQLNV